MCVWGGGGGGGGVLNEQFQRVTVFISAVSRLPFTVVILVTLPTADLTSEPSHSTIRREVQDLVGTRCSSRLCLTAHVEMIEIAK